MQPEQICEPKIEITREERERFQRDGVLALRGVISPHWLEALAAAVERDIENPGPFYHGYTPQDGVGKFHGNLRLWENDDAFKNFCFHSPLPSIAAQLMGSEQIQLLYDQLFVKEAQTANPTRWHNDQPYWPIRGRDILSCWLCLDPVSQHTGALEFVRGSHNWNRWFQPESFGEGSGAEYERNEAFEKMPDIEGNRAEYDIVSWDLEPGDIYVFQGMTVHGARGNSSSELRRRGYTVRYIGDDIRYDRRKGLSEPICCKQLRSGDKLTAAQYPRVYF